MPRTRSQTKKQELTQDDLFYLAGIFESSLNLRGVGTQGAMAISNTEDWPKAMADTYGGYHEEFQTRNTEKWYWGWFVPLQRRLELLDLLEQAHVTRTFTQDEFMKARFKMQNSIEKGRNIQDRSDDDEAEKARVARREKWHKEMTNKDVT
jgi:hypothetical protein